MRSIIVAGLFGLIAVCGAVGPVQAKGCLKGAAVGGAAGHIAGHHGVLGAMAGCAVGHHEASKHDAAQQSQNANGDNDHRSESTQ
jgi:hypothetical protein